MANYCIKCKHRIKFVNDHWLHNFKWKPPGSSKWQDDLRQVCGQPVVGPGGTIEKACSCGVPSK